MINNFGSFGSFNNYGFRGGQQTNQRQTQTPLEPTEPGCPGLPGVPADPGEPKKPEGTEPKGDKTNMADAEQMQNNKGENIISAFDAYYRDPFICIMPPPPQINNDSESNGDNLKSLNGNMSQESLNTLQDAVNNSVAEESNEEDSFHQNDLEYDTKNYDSWKDTIENQSEGNVTEKQDSDSISNEYKQLDNTSKDTIENQSEGNVAEKQDGSSDILGKVSNQSNSNSNLAFRKLSNR